MTHRMMLIRTHNNTEEWFCPFCERTLHICWNPFEKNVVFDGDEREFHVGIKGGLEIGLIYVGGANNEKKSQDSEVQRDG